jgi:acyl-CoA dehydrogenase
MTGSLTRTLRKFKDADLIACYFDALTSQDIGAMLQGAMFMTEQAAGSHVGATESLSAHPPAKNF